MWRGLGLRPSLGWIHIIVYSTNCFFKHRGRHIPCICSSKEEWRHEWVESPSPARRLRACLVAELGCAELDPTALTPWQACHQPASQPGACASFKGIEAPPAPQHLGHAQPGWEQTCGEQRWSCSAPHGSSGP
jgi:hypothetical protein